MQLAIAAGVDRDLSKDVPEGLAEARAAVNEMLDALAAPKLVLGGFSQGAMLSLDVALRNPSRKLAGLVQLSGTLIAEQEWRPLLKGRQGLAVYQAHGRADAILPFGAAERLRDLLAKEGEMNVEFDPFHGPHTIPLQTLKRLSTWIRDLG
jgi:phospholipase/carboxylesterase